jgi:cellobiose-specific phosphotransferase system component IIA
MTTKTFYKISEYYKDNFRDRTCYRADEIRGTVVAEGVVRLLNRRHGHSRDEIVLESGLADTPKLAFDKLVAEKQLEVEEARLRLEAAEKELKKVSTAHDDWLKEKAHEEDEREQRIKMNRQHLIPPPNTDRDKP